MDARSVPLLAGIRPYERSWLSRDVVAGITLAALAIPEVMGYTKISGTPVITSSMSSLPEVVGDAAMLVNPENVFDIARGIKEVLLDDDLRQRLSEAGRVHAARYSWKNTAQQVLEIYREIGR